MGIYQFSTNNKVHLNLRTSQIAHQNVNTIVWTHGTFKKMLQVTPIKNLDIEDNKSHSEVPKQNIPTCKKVNHVHFSDSLQQYL